MTLSCIREYFPLLVPAIAFFDLDSQKPEGAHRNSSPVVHYSAFCACVARQCFHSTTSGRYFFSRMSRPICVCVNNYIWYVHMLQLFIPPTVFETLIMTLTCETCKKYIAAVTTLHCERNSKHMFHEDCIWTLPDGAAPLDLFICRIFSNTLSHHTS